VCRLDALRVQMHLAARDGRGGQAARLVKPAMPQPFVQAMPFGLLARRRAVVNTAIITG
jgi:hypothetical protein